MDLELSSHLLSYSYTFRTISAFILSPFLSGIRLRERSMEIVNASETFSESEGLLRTFKTCYVGIHTGSSVFTYEFLHNSPSEGEPALIKLPIYGKEEH